MKNLLILFCFILSIGFGCKKDDNKKDETNTTSTTSNSTAFDGTIAGKWDIVSCPKEFYVKEGIPSTKALFRFDGIGVLTGSGWSKDISWRPATHDSIIGTFYFGFHQPGKLIFKSPSEYKFDIEGQLFHLKKTANMLCPNITALEYDDVRDNMFHFKGNIEYLRGMDIMSNMQFDSYNPNTGECVFISDIRANGNYITFNTKGCDIVTFKNEFGIWKKSK